MFITALLLATAPIPAIAEKPELTYDFAVTGGPTLRVFINCDEDIGQVMTKKEAILLSSSQSLLDSAVKKYKQGKISDAALQKEIERYSRLRASLAEIRTFDRFVCRR